MILFKGPRNYKKIAKVIIKIDLTRDQLQAEQFNKMFNWRKNLNPWKTVGVGLYNHISVLKLKVKNIPMRLSSKIHRATECKTLKALER